MAGHWLTPSFFETVISAPLSPIVVMESRFTLLVRSGLMTVQESPRSVDLKTLFAATRSVPLSFGEMIIGVSHSKRYASPGLGAGVTLSAFGRMLFDSPVTLSRRIMLPSCVSVQMIFELLRSGTDTKPSPVAIWNL